MALAFALAVAVPALAAEQQASIRFRGDTCLVLIPATVLDRSGRTVRGLKRDQFRLFDDKAERQIFSEEDLPLSMAVLFDTSGSMASRIAGARRAVHAMLETADPGDEF